MRGIFALSTLVPASPPLISKNLHWIDSGLCRKQESLPHGLDMDGHEDLIQQFGGLPMMPRPINPICSIYHPLFKILIRKGKQSSIVIKL